jgi:hypothetical protein
MFPQFSAAIFVDSMVADNSRHLFQVEVSSAAVVGTPRRRCVGVTAPRPAWLSGFQHPGSCTDVGLACPLAPRLHRQPPSACVQLAATAWAALAPVRGRVGVFVDMLREWGCAAGGCVSVLVIAGRAGACVPLRPADI